MIRYLLLIFVAVVILCGVLLTCQSFSNRKQQQHLKLLQRKLYAAQVVYWKNKLVLPRLQKLTRLYEKLSRQKISTKNYALSAWLYALSARWLFKLKMVKISTVKKTECKLVALQTNTSPQQLWRFLYAMQNATLILQLQALTIQRTTKGFSCVVKIEVCDV